MAQATDPDARRSAPASAAGHAPVMTERRVALIGGLMVAIGPISMALYTPAMTEIMRAFGTTEAAVKMTLTLYFGGFACAQLIAGPLSDALGRRPVTFAFLGVYCLASLAALAAPSVEALMVARFLQGIGASAGVAISRAIVRDLFTGERSSRIMNLIGIILALGPALAPTIGGLLLIAAGWRSIFVAMAAFGAVAVTVTGLAMRETAPADRARLRFAALWASYRELLGSRHFLACSGVVAGSIGALYAQATFLPFILMQRVGLSPAEFGLSMLFQSGSFFAGSLLVRALMRRVSAYGLVAPGLGLIALGSLGVLTLLVRPPTLLHVMLPVAVYAAGIAFVMPAMTTAALAPFPRIAGAAAALMGFLQMGAGLVMGSLGALMGDPLLAMGTLIPLMGAFACLAYADHRRHPQRAGPEPRGDAIAGLPVGRTLLPEEPPDPR
ncbi:MAG TPA: multidrug effflux MFS transporter [Amaricoccus sp.]|nr:multidrug effflux MFS transporter [Amaricoccus sp.]HMR62006.1 multidrug effflux MFS transporter [Amaricoccus sp.]HMT98988.1 multidrug effflux MFS transporter [Amaricoccus sp.]